MIVRRSNVAMLLLVLSYACVHQRDVAAVDASICAVAATPQQYANRTIRTHASILSDGIEHIVLVDERCPGVGVTPLFSATDVVSGGAALSAAIYAGRPGTTDKRITATFVGVVHRNTADAPPLTIELSGVSEIDVTPIH
jgi:hypothetical protein